MLASGNYLANPLQVLGGQFTQDLKSSGPWGSTVATPTDGNAPTGEADSLAALGANVQIAPGTADGVSASTPMPAAGMPTITNADTPKGGPLAAMGQGSLPTSPGAVGTQGYSQLLAQQAGQLPALQQQQQSNRAALLQALTNLTQQQANYKPPSQINQALMGEAAGMANPASQQNPLAGALEGYAGGAARDAAQQKAVNDQMIANQMKIAEFPTQWSDEDVKTAQAAMDEGAKESFEQKLETQKELAALQLEKEKVALENPSILGTQGITPAPGTVPVINNDVTKAFPNIDPAVAARAQAIIEGRDQLMPREKDLQAMKEIITTVDPTYDFSTPGARIKTANDYAPSGGSGKQISALNVTLGHLSDLDSQVDKLGNVSVPLVGSMMNYLGNQAAAASGKSNITTATQTSGMLSTELANIWKANGATDPEIAARLKDFDVYSNSPEQLHGNIKNAASNLIASKLDSLTSNYQNEMGGKVPAMGVLQPKNAAFLQKLGVDTSNYPLMPSLTTAKPSLNSNPNSPTLPGSGAQIPAVTTAVNSAPPGAVEHLKQNPNLAADFDAKYGAGASAKILGGQ